MLQATGALCSLNLLILTGVKGSDDLRRQQDILGAPGPCRDNRTGFRQLERCLKRADLVPYSGQPTVEFPLCLGTFPLPFVLLLTFRRQ
jgi:hypothetical protein